MWKFRSIPRQNPSLKILNSSSTVNTSCKCNWCLYPTSWKNSTCSKFQRDIIFLWLRHLLREWYCPLLSFTCCYMALRAWPSLVWVKILGEIFRSQCLWPCELLREPSWLMLMPSKEPKLRPRMWRRKEGGQEGEVHLHTRGSHGHAHGAVSNESSELFVIVSYHR